MKNQIISNENLEDIFLSKKLLEKKNYPVTAKGIFNSMGKDKFESSMMELLIALYFMCNNLEDSYAFITDIIGETKAIPLSVHFQSNIKNEDSFPYYEWIATSILNFALKSFLLKNYLNLSIKTKDFFISVLISESCMTEFFKNIKNNPKAIKFIEDKFPDWLLISENPLETRKTFRKVISQAYFQLPNFLQKQRFLVDLEKFIAEFLIGNPQTLQRTITKFKPKN